MAQLHNHPATESVAQMNDLYQQEEMHLKWKQTSPRLQVHLLRDMNWMTRYDVINKDQQVCWKGKAVL